MAEETVITVDSATHRALIDLAEVSKTSVESVLQQAIETHRRRVFLDHTNEAFGALRENDEGWQKYRAELQAWDCTHADGL